MANTRAGRRKQRKEIDDFVSFSLLVMGVVFAGILLTLVTRIQSGLIGIILAVMVVGLVIYWVREIRRSSIQEIVPLVKPRDERWTCDVIEQKNAVTVVAEVPGPEEQVRVSLREGGLEILGGKNFSKNIKVSNIVEILHMSYRNGILNVRLRRDTISD